MLCPDNMRPYLDDVLAGEYDINYLVTKPAILDIGANCGAFALWALRKWPDAKVICYEPGSESFDYLKRNLSEDSRVTLNNFAIGDERNVKLYHGRHNLGEASCKSWYAGTDSSETIITKSPLTLPGADIIKIDTEGSECEILLPLLKTGRQYDVILLEYHSESDRRILDIALIDYKLCGAKIFHPDRGVLKYFHKSLNMITASEAM